MRAKKNESLRWILSATAAAIYVAVTQLATRDKLTAAHWVALDLFAFALPICVAAVIDWTADSYDTMAMSQAIVVVLAVLASAAGTGALFFSFGAWPGVVF